MHVPQTTSPPTWFWILVGFLLIWNLLGVMAFIQQIMLTSEQINTLPPAERELYLRQPFWVLVAFSFAVFGGTIGCLALLFKKSLARTFFWLSLVGILVQMSHSFFISNALNVYGPGAAVMPLMILLVAIFLIWFSGKAIGKGWVA